MDSDFGLKINAPWQSRYTGFRAVGSIGLDITGLSCYSLLLFFQGFIYFNRIEALIQLELDGIFPV